MKYKAICFDIDGTLYPIRVMNRRIFRLSVVHPGFGMQYRKARREFRKHQGSFRKEIPFRWREAAIIQTGSGEEPEMEFSEDAFRERYGKTYDRLDRWAYRKMDRQYERTKTFEGVAKTFEKIRNNGLKVGVFTDFPLLRKLEGMNLASLVDFAASSDDAGFLKPDTHCFEYLLYNLKMDPQDVLYVGDSYEKDIVGANAASIDAVLVNVMGLKAGDAEARYPLAKAVFATWDEFDKWLTAELEDN